MAEFRNSITDIKGIKVGQREDRNALTGCTVILFEKGAVGGVSQRGGAPGTRETDLLRPMHLIEKIHAVVLAGGSAFGLDAASGVMRYLEERKIGFDSGNGVVPIVPSAILFDLGLGKNNIRPDAKMGYEACEQASTEKPTEGNSGAGTGASVGKIFGMSQAMKSGIGTSSIEMGNGVVLGAIAAVNAFGDVVDYRNNQIMAGARAVKPFKSLSGDKPFFLDTLATLKTAIGKTVMSFASKQNTIIGVIATNARLDKCSANFLAEAASNGIAMAIRPAFTMFDGDTIFSMATGEKMVDINILCAFAPIVFAESIYNAIRNADPLPNLPSFKSLKIS